MHRSHLVPAQYHLALPILPNSIGFGIYTRHTAYGWHVRPPALNKSEHSHNGEPGKKNRLLRQEHHDDD